VPKFQPKRHQQIQRSMFAHVVTGTDLSDLADSSGVKHVLTAAARSDSEQYNQMLLLLALFSIDTAAGDDLDDRAKDIQPAEIERIQATKASGTVVFSRVGNTGTVTISVGQKVKTAEGVVFSTTSVGTIADGFYDSNAVGVVAEVPGSTGRVAAGTVIKFVSKPVGVDSVTNGSAFVTGGLDKETDAAFRQRIKDYVAGLARCHLLGIEANLLGQEDPVTGAVVQTVKAIEDNVDRGNVTVYVDDGTGTAESSIAKAVSLAGDGLGGAFAVVWNGTTLVTVTDPTEVTEKDFIRLDSDTQFFDIASIADSVCPGTWTWDGTATILATDTTGISSTADNPGNFVRLDSDGQFFRVLSFVPNTSVTIDNTAGRTIPIGATGSSFNTHGPVQLTIDDPSAEGIPTGATGSSKCGEHITDSLAGPPPDSAVGGETRLFLDNKPVKDSSPISITSSINGKLTRGTDFTLNPASGQVDFIAPLTVGEVVGVDYTYFTGLIAYVQKLIDGDPADRINFPGMRAGGVLVIVLTPQILVQNVEVTVTVLDGYDYDVVKDSVRQAIKDYINALTISGDVIVSQIVRKCMAVAGVYNVDVITPTNDVILLDDELARTQDANVTVN
jgi:uncharacterized phage protein gp47/JayE